MSRQQSRPSGDGAIDPSLVQKKRARHRLVGAICLCILAAIIVPLVLESEPRPRDHELPIELAVPARGDAAVAPDATAEAATHAPGTAATTAPLASAADAARPGGAVASGQIGHLGGAGAAPHPQVDGGPSAESRSAVKTVTPSAPGETPKPEAPRAESASQAARQEAARQAAARQEAAKAAEAAKTTDAAKTADAARAAKAAETKAAEAKAAPAKPPAAPEKPTTPRKDEPDVLARLIERADDGTGSGAAAGKAASRRFLVQIGAYSNVQSAKTASDRAVQLGLRPFQETVKTAQGDWIRVRVGPFSSRQDAERAQQDLKRAGVTAAIIAL